MLERYTPRPEQEEAIEALLRDGAHLCRAEVGAGKTLVGVEAAIRAGARTVLVVGPLNTRTGWQRTFVRQGSELPFRHVKSLTDDKGLEALIMGEPGVYFMSWTLYAMYAMWHKFPIDFVVWDEVHRGQNRKSLTHQAMLSTHNAKWKLGLSATPWGNQLHGAWAVIKSLWGSEVAGYFWPWVTQHLSKVPDEHAKFAPGKQERVPGSIWASVPSKSDFPSPFTGTPAVHPIEVELAPAQRRVYERFEKEAFVWLEDNPLATDLPAVQYIRLMEILLAVPSIRQDWIRVKDPATGHWEKVWGDVVYYKPNAKSTKIDAALEVLEDLYADGPVPVLMFTHSEKFATLLTKRLQAKGYDARRFVGGMGVDEREWKREAFGREFDILVATVAAIGEGTDGLQEVCHIEFWFSQSDNRVLNQQARGRLSRPGQEKEVQRYLFMAQDTVETTRQLPRLEEDQMHMDASFTEREEAA